MLLKKYLPIIGAGAGGIIIAFFIVQFLNAPSESKLIGYETNLTIDLGLNETITGPFFYWDYLNLNSGDKFNYSLSCDYCFNDSLEMNVIDVSGDELTIDFVFKITSFVLNKSQVTLNSSFNTTKTDFLIEASADENTYYIYGIFNQLLGSPIIDVIAWNNLSINRPVNFTTGVEDFQLFMSNETVFNGFNCRIMTIVTEGFTEYYYCINENLGMPVIAEHYNILGTLDWSIKLLSHQV